jgi:peroxiredoxin (alkyl hydroperoxide reductase subunit C)
MTETAQITYQQHSMPRLNEPAPDFDAVTTHGQRTLSDYKGKWLILFSHPADFTPVCTTEFMAFAKAHDKFAALNTDLLGLSMKVANAYGMIMPGAADTSAVRATFIIDPEGILRAMVYYPMSNGRSIDEFLRLVQALQTSDKNKVATPENWKPGEPVIVPPPQTTEAADARKGEGFEYTDWYFSKKSL